MVEVVPQIDYDDLALQFLSVSHRTPRFIAWNKGMLSQVSWLNKNFWNYCYGDYVSSFYSNSATYANGVKVVTFQGVYVSTASDNYQNNPDITYEYDSVSGVYNVGNSVSYGVDSEGNKLYYQCTHIISSPELFNPAHWVLLGGSIWYKISPSYIGAQERSQYCSQKLIFEYALNRWFRTNFWNPTSFRDGTTPYTVNTTSITGIWYLSSGGTYNTSDIFITTKPITISSFISYTTDSQSSDSFTNSSGNKASFTTQISASDTTYQYIVWIPTSLATLLGLNYIQIISEVVNLIGLIGTTFSVSTY